MIYRISIALFHAVAVNGQPEFDLGKMLSNVFQFNNQFDSDTHSVKSVKTEELKKSVQTESIVGVLFYAKWCYYCQRVMPEWDEAARKLKLHKPKGIPMLRYDAHTYQMTNKFAKELGIEPVDRFPTIIFFVDNKPYTYPDDEDRNWQSILKWTNKLADRQHVLSSIEDLEHYLHDTTSAVIGLFNDPTVHDNAFKRAALEFEDSDVLFASSISPDVSKKIAEHVRDHHVHRCQTIVVGPNKQGQKSVEAKDELPFDDMECGSQPMNPQNPRWMDTFSSVVTGKRLSVQRTDQVGGPWLQELKLKCCVDMNHMEKNDPINIPIPGLLMFTDHPDEPFTVYDGDANNLTKENIKEFASERALDQVTELNDDNSSKVFAQNNPVLYVSLKGSPDAAENVEVEKVIREAVKTKGVNRKKVVTVVVKEDSNISNRLDRMLNIAEDETAPQIRIFEAPGSRGNRGGREPKKFKIAGPITTATIAKFTEDHTAGKLFEYVKSEEVIEDDDMDPDDARVLVGDNLEKYAFDETKDVFVDMFAPWCGHCKKLEPIWRDLFRELKHVPTLQIAKIDATRNEIKVADVNAYPTILLFPAGPNQRNMRPKEYNGPREMNVFINWLQKNVAKKFDRNKPTTTRAPRSSGGTKSQNEGDEEYFEHSVDL